MGVYIKGMKMPSSCDECPFGKKRPKEYHCYTLNRSISHAKWFDDVADDCPLVKVKEPHGSLIDAEVLSRRAYDRRTLTTVADMINDINNAPTVIEAEGEE